MQPQLGPLFRRHLAERAEGPNEGVLDDLLGVFPVAGHAQSKTVQTPLEFVDDALETLDRRYLIRGPRRTSGRGCRLTRSDLARFDHALLPKATVRAGARVLQVSRLRGRRHDTPYCFFPVPARMIRE